MSLHSVPGSRLLPSPAKRLRRTVAATLTGATVCSVLFAASPASAATPAFSVFDLPTSPSRPSGIAVGADGNLWFTESASNNIGRITPTGTLTEFTIPTANADAERIVSGLDGNLWFTETGVGQIGRITPAGVITEFAANTPHPYGITNGGPSDSRIYYTDFVLPNGSGANGKIGRINTSAPAPGLVCGAGGGAPVNSIVFNPGDGKLYFTAPGFREIQRTPSAFDTCGTIERILLPGSSNPRGITVGKDGNVWWVDSGRNVVSRMIPSTKAVVSFPINASGADRRSITPGPAGDSGLWITERDSDRIARVSTTGIVGAVSEFLTPRPAPEGIVAGPDGKLWFTQFNGNSVASFVYNTTQFVNHSYNDIFGRVPDAGGLAFWNGRLDQGLDRSSYSLSLTFSTEYRGHVVDGIFGDLTIRCPDTFCLNLLGRLPDEGGRAFWVNRLNQVTFPRAEAEIAASDEFFTTAGGTNSAFVRALYSKFLSPRVPSDSEVNGWTNAMAGGLSRLGVASNFSGSDEFFTRVVNGYYQKLLGRVADPGGLAFWVGRLRSGQREDALTADLLGSQEYYESGIS